MVHRILQHKYDVSSINNSRDHCFHTNRRTEYQQILSSHTVYGYAMALFTYYIHSHKANIPFYLKFSMIEGYKKKTLEANEMRYETCGICLWSVKFFQAPK